MEDVNCFDDISSEPPELAAEAKLRLFRGDFTDLVIESNGTCKITSVSVSYPIRDYSIRDSRDKASVATKAPDSQKASDMQKAVTAAASRISAAAAGIDKLTAGFKKHVNGVEKKSPDPAGQGMFVEAVPVSGLLDPICESQMQRVGSTESTNSIYKTSGSGLLDTPQTFTADIEVRYAAEMQMLRDMGYEDDERNALALLAYDGHPQILEAALASPYLAEETADPW